MSPRITKVNPPREFLAGATHPTSGGVGVWGPVQVASKARSNNARACGFPACVYSSIESSRHVCSFPDAVDDRTARVSSRFSMSF